MTELSKEILDTWQVRHTKKQKAAFEQFLAEQLPGLRAEESGLIKSRNLILGDLDDAKVVFSAHYDTCAILPFPNFLPPKNIPLYVLFNLLVTAVLIVVVFLASFVTTQLFHSFWITYFSSLAICFLFCFLMLGGKANPHTVNDNTSGVITLCELYDALTEEERANAAFVFFDNEESGLLGSAQFRKKHKEAMTTKLLINLDCVSDGDWLMLIRNASARATWDDALKAAFSDVPGKTVLWENSSNTLYPSDQVGFPCYTAIAAFRKKKGVGLYISRIHTKKDTVLQEENIRWLRDSGKRLMEQLTK